MKKYVGLSFFTVLIVILGLTIPIFTSNFVSKVQIVSPKKINISEDIYAGGAVEEWSKRDVYLDYPVVPEEVFVSVGDTVEANQLIATIDKKATQQALLNLLEASSLIPTEYISVIGNLNIDTTKIESFIPSEIRAETSGVITQSQLLSGAMILPKSSACTISKVDIMKVKMSISETDIDKIRLGDEVLFKASATGDEIYKGSVEQIFPAASSAIIGASQETVVGIYVRINEGTTRLKPGFTVNGVIKKTTADEAFVIPYEAVMQDDNNIEYVYVYENARAVRRDIKTGKELAEGVQIIDGITETDVIVKDASKVKKENHLLKIVNK